MKVSVIIPVKNRANLLAVTLDNILGQSKPPHEVIVVDDGSTDNIDEVEHWFKDNVLFDKNAGNGPGAARNTGLRRATGDAIQFFDSDDLMTVNKLEVQAALMEEQRADIVYGPYVKAIQTPSEEWEQVDVVMQYHPLPPGRLKDFVLEGWCPITQSVLFSKELIDKAGFWREDLMPHEDYEYWYRIAKVAKRMAHTNKAAVIYRQHENQITDKAVSNKDRWMDGIQASQCILNNLDKEHAAKSKRIFIGRYASSKMGYIQQFGNTEALKVSFTEKLLARYNAVYNKRGRIKTGTAWLPMHGVLKDSSSQFQDYIKQL